MNPPEVWNELQDVDVLNSSVKVCVMVHVSSGDGKVSACDLEVLGAVNERLHLLRGFASASLLLMFGSGSRSQR